MIAFLCRKTQPRCHHRHDTDVLPQKTDELYYIPSKGNCYHRRHLTCWAFDQGGAGQYPHDPSRERLIKVPWGYYSSKVNLGLMYIETALPHP